MIEYAKVEKEELISQGELKKAKESARVMLTDNSPIDYIIRVTGLSREQIERLKL